MYRMLLANNSKLPEEGLYMIRFHSFYPYHTGGSYLNLADDKDNNMLPWIQAFK